MFLADEFKLNAKCQNVHILPKCIHKCIKMDGCTSVVFEHLKNFYGKNKPKVHHENKEKRTCQCFLSVFSLFSYFISVFYLLSTNFAQTDSCKEKL